MKKEIAPGIKYYYERVSPCKKELKDLVVIMNDKLTFRNYCMKELIYLVVIIDDKLTFRNYCQELRKKPL